MQQFNLSASLAKATAGIARCSERRSAVTLYASTHVKKVANGIKVGGWSAEKKRAFAQEIEDFESSSDASAPTRRSSVEKAVKRVSNARMSLKMKIHARVGQGKENLGDVLGFVLVDVVGAAVAVACLL
jgi:uncharacterized protein Yka (UPF0111/DUF47 family)